MGEWAHPAHYTETARAFAKRERAAIIGVFVEMCLPRLREAARRCGYALGVHGTLIRDLDLIACPWTDKAASPDDLAEAIGVAIDETTGWSHQRKPDWTAKPHGRLAVTLIAGTGGDIHVDLSVMPRLEPAPKEPPE